MFIKANKKSQIFILLGGCVGLLLSSTVPFFIKFLFDKILLKGAYNYLIGWCGLLLTILVLQGITTFLFFKYYFKLTGIINSFDLIKEAFSSLLKKSPAFFQVNSQGSIISKVLNDTFQVGTHIAIKIPMKFLNYFNLIISIIILSYLSLKLTLIALVLIPIYYILIKFYSNKIQLTTKLEREKFDQVTEELREKVEGMTVIRTYACEDYFKHKFFNILQQWFHILRINLLWSSSIESVIIFLLNLSPLLVMGIGIFEMKKGFLTLGSLMGFYTYMGRLYEPIKNLSDFQLTTEKTKPIINRLDELFISNNNLSQNLVNNLHRVGLNKNIITFNNVTFSYNSHPVLVNIDFEIKQNELVGIIGANGKGKSTIFKLLLGEYITQNGQIYIFSEDIKNVSCTILRKNIALAHQNNFIFNDTIKNNIIFGNVPNRTFEKYSQSFDLFKLEKKLEHLDGLTGFTGQHISMGERQRIAITRALISDKPILLFDEPYAHLDKSYKEFFINAIMEKRGKQTILMISHDKDIIDSCDKIIELV
jgi:ABC-type multidrug transport system fused ATPase/permease subunit